MNYWVISDTYGNHESLVGKSIRPKNYSDIIFKQIHLNIKRDDVIIHLGDVAFKNGAEWNRDFCYLKHDAKKWLVLGNHDQGHSYSWFLSNGWDFAAETFTLKLFGHTILFSHVPMKYDGMYTLNIHGHFHDFPPEKHEPELVAIKNGKQILFSLESTKYQPVMLKTIVEKWNKDHGKR